MCLLDVLDNMPHLRLSDDHMKSVLWLLKALNVPDTPSLYALRKTQKRFAVDMDIQPHEHTSALGDTFSAVSPEDLLALVSGCFVEFKWLPDSSQDWANPHVRNLMQVYPEITSSISESWQTGKWCDEVPLEELSPMWADWDNSPDRHFYVNEVACTKAGKYIFPKRWVIFNKQECVEAHPVRFSERVSHAECQLSQSQNIFQRRKYRVRKNEIIRIPATELQLTHPEIKTLGQTGFQSELAVVPK
jgi:hypothetical protein